jgi:CheY-like chemotaxis protein
VPVFSTGGIVSVQKRHGKNTKLAAASTLEMMPLKIHDALPKADHSDHLEVFGSGEYILFREPTAMDDRSLCPIKTKAGCSETPESPGLVKVCEGNHLGRRGSSFLVLIVDDDSAFRKLLYTFFDNGSGFDACVEAQDGVEAIAKTKQLSPNLVVLDFSMPEMNGLELARELKAIAPQLAIFMLTAEYDLSLEKEALSCGVVAVFSKLDDLATLVANARAVCGIE